MADGRVCSGATMFREKHKEQGGRAEYRVKRQDAKGTANIKRLEVMVGGSSIEQNPTNQETGQHEEQIHARPGQGAELGP